MTYEKQDPKWENWPNDHLFFRGSGYFCVLSGLILSYIGTKELLRGSGFAFFLFAQIGFLVTLLYNHFGFKYIANKYKDKIDRINISIEYEKLIEIIYNSIKRIDEQEDEVKQHATWYHVKLSNDITIIVAKDLKTSLNWVSIDPYNEQTKTFVDTFIQVIDEEIDRYSQDCGVIENVS